jgi:hypothetical protein
VPHKKRGRPRLREDREAVREEERSSSALAPGPAAQSWPLTRAHRRTNSGLRMLRAQQDSEGRPLQSYSAFGSPDSTPAAMSSRPVTSYPFGIGPITSNNPIAFLNMDLTVLKMNDIFKDMISAAVDGRGRSIADFLAPGHSESLQRLRTELRDERDHREPAYMPPINPRGEQEALDLVAFLDVEALTQGYTERAFEWTFKLSSSQSQVMRVAIRLAKTSIFFVALVLQPAVQPTRTQSPALFSAGYGPLPSSRLSGTSPITNTVTPSREHPYFTGRLSPSTSSNPPSPYNFQSPQATLPPTSVQTSPYGTSPTSRPESGYFYPPPPAPSQLPTSLQNPTSRPPSATSDPMPRGRTSLPPTLGSLQLPPLRGSGAPPPPLMSPQFSDPDSTQNERVRRREPSSTQSDQSGDGNPESSKRRRLNIHEVLD